MSRKYFRIRPYLLWIFVSLLLYIFLNLLIENEQILNFRVQENSVNAIAAPSVFKMSFTRRIPKKLVKDVNCAAILNGDNAEINRAKTLSESGKYSRIVNNDKDYITLTKNCVIFKRIRGYDSYVASGEEASFPIAFSVLLYKDVEQVERLLRAIYTPQNYYCLHIDADSKQEVHDAIQGIADCFDNIFVVSRKEYVVYAGFSRLQADLNCMENLLQRSDAWKYLINLPSQEFPLKTNKEIVKILKIYNGANDIAGRTGVDRVVSRFQHRFIYQYEDNSTKPKMLKTDQKKGDPPYNITVVKGGAYCVFSREFVHFVINNKIARELLDWFRDVYSPDEYYWATLQYNHHIGTPGSYYKGKPDLNPRLAVYAAWWYQDPCQGKFVRGVCVFGVGDLKTLVGKKQLFANKFYYDFQPYALDCMEEWHLNRTAEGSLKSLNISYYQSLPFIKRTI